MTDTERFYAYTMDVLFVTGKNTRGILTEQGEAHNEALTTLQNIVRIEGAVPLNMSILCDQLIELDDTWFTDPVYMDPDYNMNKDPLDWRRTHHNLAAENMKRIWPLRP